MKYSDKYLNWNIIKKIKICQKRMQIVPFSFSPRDIPNGQITINNPLCLILDFLTSMTGMWTHLCSCRVTRGTICYFYIHCTIYVYRWHSFLTSLFEFILHKIYVTPTHSYNIPYTHQKCYVDLPLWRKNPFVIMSSRNKLFFINFYPICLPRYYSAGEQHTSLCYTWVQCGDRRSNDILT